MLLYDREKHRIINLDHVTHLSSVDRIDSQTNEEIYLIVFKMAQSVPVVDYEAECGQEQLTLCSRFGNKQARDSAFSNFVNYLIEKEKLFIVR